MPFKSKKQMIAMLCEEKKDEEVQKVVEETSTEENSTYSRSKRR